jgi:hypothetical protein
LSTHHLESLNNFSDPLQYQGFQCSKNSSFIKKVLTQLEEGGLLKQTAKNTLKALDALKDELVNPFKVLAVLQTHIPERLLQSHYAEQNPAVFGKREVILSLYLAGE